MFPKNKEKDNQIISSKNEIERLKEIENHSISLQLLCEEDGEDISSLKFLLSKGARVDYLNSKNENSLQTACRNKNTTPHFFKVLLENNQNLIDQQSDLIKPLLLSSKYNILNKLPVLVREFFFWKDWIPFLFFVAKEEEKNFFNSHWKKELISTSHHSSQTNRK